MTVMYLYAVMYILFILDLRARLKMAGIVKSGSQWDMGYKKQSISSVCSP